MKAAITLLLLSLLAAALPADVSLPSPLEAAVEARQVRRFCLTGCDQRDFRGQYLLFAQAMKNSMRSGLSMYFWLVAGGHVGGLASGRRWIVRQSE